MSEITVTIPNNVTQDQVDTARTAFVDSLSSNYGAGRRYAAVLVGMLGTAWITMAHDAKGAEGDAMRTQRDALYSDLKKAGHSNPSVKWKQIKGYAAELTADPADTEDGEEGESSGGAKHSRSLQLRLIEDLTTLHKACKKEKAKTDQQIKAAMHIAAALADLGVDISNL